MKTLKVDLETCLKLRLYFKQNDIVYEFVEVRNFFKKTMYQISYIHDRLKEYQKHEIEALCLR